MTKALMVFLLLLGLGGKVWAGGFNLKSIGDVSTEGRQISHWWYSGLQPVLSGEAIPGSEVTITIDETARQINTDSDGNWNFAWETALTAGDHTVGLESGGSTISFTLTLGSENVDWSAVGAGAGESLPAVGVITPTLFLSGGGLMMILSAKIGGGGKKKKSIY
tara:strand:+ start:157 stop:648 length:492 start_codon:yes stop_codon:yes gene_type:complete